MAVVYTAAEAEAILASYRRLFPHVAPGLADYWNHHRQRPWGWLTSDFHRLGFDRFSAFHQAMQEPSLGQGEPQQRGERLREMARAHGTGYSLGISPWTDDLLLRTVSEQTEALVVVVGHDWYPIVTTDGSYQARSPLQRQSVWDEPRYGRAVPPCLFLAPRVGTLFLNLVPDFRQPGAEPTGSFGPYAFWQQGFQSLCMALAHDVHLAAVVSWGGPVWECLRGLTPLARSGMGIRQAVLHHHAQRQSATLTAAGRAIPYYPLEHPSYDGNFRREAHLAAYDWVCTALSTST